MFWIYLALAYLAGALSAGILLLLVCCFLISAARQEEAMTKLEPPNYGS